MTRAIDPNLLAQAKDLKSEDGENPEYDRALVELVSRTSGFTSDDYDTVAREIGIVGAPARTEWGFMASASVWFNTDALGRVTSVDVNVLDGVDHPDEFWEDEECGTPDEKERAIRVYESAAALGWKLPAAWILPTGFNFRGTI